MAYYFVHLHKTGGSTFNAQCVQFMKMNEDFYHDGPWGRAWRRGHRGKAWSRMTKEELRNFKVVAGHNVSFLHHTYFHDQNPKYILFLREPADRLASWYNHAVCCDPNVDLSFEEWYERLGKNSIQRSLSARRFISFDQCYMIAVTQHLDLILPWLFLELELPVDYDNYRVAIGNGQDIRKLGHPDTRELTKQFYLTTDQRARIMKENEIDYCLYYEALKRSHKLVSSLYAT